MNGCGDVVWEHEDILTWMVDPKVLYPDEASFECRAIGNGWVFIKTGNGAQFWYLLIWHPVILAIQGVGAINADSAHVTIIFRHDKGEWIKEQAHNKRHNQH